MKEEFKLFLSSFCEASTLPPAKHLSTFSVVGETSPSHLAMPRHLATKNFWKGVARPGDSPNNPGEVQTFKRSRLTILHREIFEIIVSGDSTVPFHWNGVPTDESLICGFWIHPQHNSEGALLLIIHSQCYVCEVLLIFLEEWVNLPLTWQLELMILFFLFWTSHNMKYPAFLSHQSHHHSPGSHTSHLATLAAGECSGRFHHHPSISTRK